MGRRLLNTLSPLLIPAACVNDAREQMILNERARRANCRRETGSLSQRFIGFISRAASQPTGRTLHTRHISNRSIFADQFNRSIHSSQADKTQILFFSPPPPLSALHLPSHPFPYFFFPSPFFLSPQFFQFHICFPFPFSVAKRPPKIQLGGLGERCKLLQRG